MKLSNDVIEQIQSSDKDKSNTEVGRELGVNRETVAKYRKLKEDIAEQTANALDWTDEMRWFTNKVEEAEQQMAQQEKNPKLTPEQRKQIKEEKAKLELLKSYSPKDIKELINYVSMNNKKEIDKKIWQPWHLKFWIVSDTHFGSKQCAREELQMFYEKAKDMGVECFVHAGDIVDWSWVYHWQQFEQDRVGFEEQLNDVKENYPNVWLPTYFIWWNHDENFLKTNWVNICKAIEVVRKDLINLWFYDARLKLNWIEINLHHWWGSLSYAKSYKMNKYLDWLVPWNEPDVFILWHYHAALYDFHRGIHSFMPASFLKENLLAKRFNLGNVIWWWVVEIDKDKQWHSTINMEFLNM